MESLPDDFRCRLCGRKEFGVYCLDGFSLALCTSGEQSCLFHQVVRHERSAGEIIQRALERVLARGLLKTVECPAFLRNVVQYLYGTEKDLFAVIEIPSLLQSFRENWLKDMDRALNRNDAQLLRRHVPSVPIQSLRKLISMVNGSHSGYNVYEGKKSISKQAIRRVLSSIFADLAPTDIEIRELQRLWQGLVRR